MIEELEQKFKQSHQYFMNGPASECERLLGECLEGYAALPEYGKIHPRTLQIGHLLTQVLVYEKKYHEAFQVKAKQLEYLDADEKAPADQAFFCIRQMVEIARDAEQYQPAMALCQQAVTRYQGKQIEWHAFLVLLAGTVAQAADELDKAFSHYDEVTTLLKRDNVEGHILSAFAQYDMGTLERDRDNPKKALDHFMRAEEILRGLGKSADVELRTHNQYQMALLRAEAREPQGIIQELHSCLQNHTQVFGPKVPHTAKVHASLGYHFHHGMNDKTKAKEHYTQARDIYIQWLGKESAEAKGIDGLLEILG